MKRIKELLLILIIGISVETAIQAQRYDSAPPLTVEKIQPNAEMISGITSAIFSPTGKLTALQTDHGFYLLPTDKLGELAEGLENSRFPFFEGQAKGFLPVSEKVVFAPRRGLYLLDSKALKTQPIFQMTAEDEEKGNYLSDGEMVVVSENLIISGDGNYDMGMSKGNILRFDVSRRRVRRGAQIDSFRYAYLSPSRKYVLYDHAGEQIVTADLYNIGRDLNNSIPKLFDFKRHFPKYKRTSVFPLGWIAANRFAAIVDEDQFEEYETKNFNEVKDTPAWLVMFDAATRKIIWKRQLKDMDSPDRLQQLTPTKAFFETNKGIYEVSLADGILTKLPDLKGSGFSFSYDKTQMAFFDGRRVFVSSANGANKKLAVEIPENQKNKNLIDKQMNRIEWSPDGKRLFIFDEMRLLIVTL